MERMLPFKIISRSVTVSYTSKPMFVYEAPGYHYSSRDIWTNLSLIDYPLDRKDPNDCTLLTTKQTKPSAFGRTIKIEQEGHFSTFFSTVVLDAVA